MSRTPRRFSRTGVKGSTPSSIQSSSNSNGAGVLIGANDPLCVEPDPPFGLNMIPGFGDIQQSTFLDLVRQYQKLNANVDGKFSDNWDVTSIFSDILGDNLSKDFSWDLYTRCRMNLTAYPVQILTPKFVDLGISNIDALDKSCGISTAATRI